MRRPPDSSIPTPPARLMATFVFVSEFPNWAVMMTAIAISSASTHIILDPPPLIVWFRFTLQVRTLNDFVQACPLPRNNIVQAKKDVPENHLVRELVFASTRSPERLHVHLLRNGPSRVYNWLDLNTLGGKVTLDSVMMRTFGVQGAVLQGRLHPELEVPPRSASTAVGTWMVLVGISR